MSPLTDSLTSTIESARNTCPICNVEGLVLKRECKHNVIYYVRRCPACGSLYCTDHYALVSPDYVDLTENDINAEILWCQGTHKQVVYEQLWNVLHRRRISVGSVLDIGCGTGGFLSFCESRGVRGLYGFDASSAQVEYARRSFPNLRTCSSVHEYIRFIGQRPHWDLITLWDVIEHIRKPNALLTDILEHCSPDTLVFFSTPNSLSEHIKLHVRTVLHAPHTFIPWEHVLYYSGRGITAILKKNGFKVLYLSGAKCYKRPLSKFEAIRRASFGITRRTRWALQLFVLCQKSMG